MTSKRSRKLPAPFEQKYGLAIDRGMTDGIEHGREGLSPEAQDFERHTWQRSFQRYMLDHKDEILKNIAEAKNWQAVHKSLAQHGVALRKRANGLVFVEAREGKQAMKASAFHRSCSKLALEKRLGPFEAMKKEKAAGVAQTAPSEAVTRPAHCSKVIRPRRSSGGVI